MEKISIISSTVAYDEVDRSGQNRISVSDRNVHESHSDDKPCIWLRCLVSGLPSDERRERIFVMLQVFIDDSGRGQEDAPAFVLAGYIARVPDWYTLADEWRKLMDKEPRIPRRLKGAEAYGLNGDFFHYTEAARDARLMDFVELINRCVDARVKLAIRGDEFRRILRTEKGWLRNVYQLAVETLTLGLVEYKRTHGYRGKIQFIYDRGMLRPKLLRSVFEEYFEALPKPFTEQLHGFPRMEDDEDMLPLQAADLLACYTRQEIVAKVAHQSFTSPIWRGLCEKPLIDLSIRASSMRDLKEELKGR